MPFMPYPRPNPALVTSVLLLLLLLSVMYVGSYLALVEPSGHLGTIAGQGAGQGQTFPFWSHYRWGGNSFAPRLFWPLEQVDRKLRPAAWGPFFYTKGRGHVEMDLGP
jgi:hypothetical protein